MLYGNIIFIKKSGGDGSKFPVDNKSVKIGRSDNCLIRIQNPLVAPEHCQLTVDNDGQVKIKDLSSKNPTILNDKPLGNGEVVLRHGDVIKIGERCARWEYVPSSKFLKSRGCQPSGQTPQRMVAVVTPQIRISEGYAGTSSARLSADSTAVLSERVTGAGTRLTDKAQRLSLGSRKGVPKQKTFLRRSLQLKKIAFSPQVKLRRSAVLESLATLQKGSAKKTPGRPSQTWEVKSVSPVDEQSVQILVTNRKSTPIKMPMTRTPAEKVNRSTLKSASKFSSLLTIAESSPPGVADQSNVKAAEKYASQGRNSRSSKTPVKIDKTSTSPNKTRTPSKKSLSKSNKEESHSKLSEPERSEGVTNSRRESIKSTPSAKVTLEKSVLKKLVSEKLLRESPSSAKKVDTPRKLLATPDKADRKLSAVVNLTRMESGANRSRGGEERSPKTPKQKPVSTPRPSTATPEKSSPKRSERLSNRKRMSVNILNTPKEKTKTSPRSRSASSSKRPKSAVGRKTTDGRELKRRYSAVASAERAAKKLKTIAPTKPDKNKKAALLLLGKASGRLKPLPSANAVIKQKIVKRAIKQTTKARKAAAALTSKRKVSLSRKALLQKKAVLAGKKAASVNKKKSSPSAAEPSATASTKRRSVVKSTPPKTPKEPSSRKKTAAEIPIKSKMETPSKTSDKGSTSTPAAGQTSVASNADIVHGSVPLKASENESVSVVLDRMTSPLQYLSPDALYNASRRASKRLDFPNFNSRPDFTELTPTALGLAPKEIVDVFKTPKQMKRRHSSLVTPKNKGESSIIKSASTSKISRNSVRLSNRELNDSSFNGAGQSANTTFDFNQVNTPEITVDVFVSPITSKSSLKSPSSVVKSLQKEAELAARDSPETRKEETKTVRLSRSSKNFEAEIETKTETKSGKSPASADGEPAAKKTRKSAKSPKNDLTDVKGVRRLLSTPKPAKSPLNDLRDVKGVRRLMATPKPQRSPLNDLMDVRGVRRLMESPRRRKSPKNDLTDVKGVKQLMTSPKTQKSPKNDLTDVKGVKRLMTSPKKQKSPKNDLTDVKGVKRLMTSPKKQKSPKNDLTDVKGVKQLMASPKPQKSPLNDLTDVRGVRRLMKSPRPQKSPENDLTDVRGVRRLMESVRPRKSPRNDLTDVTGVKQLLITKSPRDDLSNVSGTDVLFKTPSDKIQCLRTLYHPVSKSPKNDLSELSGVRQLFSMNKENSNLDVSLTGVAELFKSPQKSASPKKRAPDADGIELAAQVKSIRLSDENEKLALSGATKTAASVPRDTRKGRGKTAAASVTLESPTEKTSPMALRNTRSTRKAKAEKSPPATTRTRTKSERDAKEKSDEGTRRSARATSRATAGNKAAKRQVEPSKSPTPLKRTRKAAAAAAEDKSEAPAKAAVEPKAKKEVVVDAVSPESKPSPIKTRRKSIARQSPAVKKSTRAKASETARKAPRAKSKANPVDKGSVSPLKTRRKVKEASTTEKSQLSPVKTRSRAK